MFYNRALYHSHYLPMLNWKSILVCFAFAFSACNSSRKLVREYKVVPLPQENARTTENILTSSTDGKKALQEKYSKYLNIPLDNITNIKLYTFIDKWLNIPYKWGGTDEAGIDCSAFVQRLFKEVYNLQLPRTSVQQLLTDRVEPFRSPKYLAEGDLVFFRTMRNRVVSHVGVYLANGMFISASLKGVSLGSLQNDYWKKRFYVSGRVKSYQART